MNMKEYREMMKTGVWPVVHIPQCVQKAFESCPYKETDDDLCEICICDAILHLKRRLRSLKRSRKEGEINEEKAHDKK